MASSVLTLLKQGKAEERRRGLIPFSLHVWSGYEVSDHHRFIAEALGRAERREPGWTRLIIHEPPQHGKSLEITALFPSWYMGKHPDDPIILPAYGDDLAQGFSRDIRRIVKSPEYQDVFPGISLSKDSQAVHRWHLEPPHRGSVVAAGIFGAILGKGAKLMAIDDPIKNREEAESKTYREKLQEAYKTTLSTRLHKDAIVVLVMSRWHEDDLAGWLLSQNFGFRYIRLPGIADGLSADGKKKARDPMGRKKGEALWPGRFPVSMLQEQRELLGSYNYSAVYDGLPSPPGGAMFKKEYFQPAKKFPEGLEMVRFWDLAVGEEQKDDYTASGKGCVDSDGNVYIKIDVHCKKEWPKVRRLISEVARSEPEVMVGIEAVGTQKGMVQECWADPELVDVGILGIPVSVSKRIRARPAEARGECGKFYLLESIHRQDAIDECVAFDKGTNDDIVDVIGGIFKMLGLTNTEMVSLQDLLEKEDQREKDVKKLQESNGGKPIEGMSDSKIVKILELNMDRPEDRGRLARVRGSVILKEEVEEDGDGKKEQLAIQKEVKPWWAE